MAKQRSGTWPWSNWLGGTLLHNTNYIIRFIELVIQIPKARAVEKVCLALAIREIPTHWEKKKKSGRLLAVLQ